ncbi:InlB B-repeat-containing protein [Peptoniphilus sp. EMRHCC_23]|uniref:Ig-like domain-containing protein n=1 Tax=Peptoniphilus rachelemmaiella TaxID=2811779 RepID=UPI001C002A5E|nr:Ig-like domain-containing protein [Peptoniphilus rachelemmaiella]
MINKGILKKHLSLFLVIAMLFSMIPYSALAAGGTGEGTETSDPTLDIANPTLSTNLKTYYDVRGMERSNLRYANINYESTEVKDGVETITMNLSKWTDSSVGFGHKRDDKYSGQIILNFFDKNFYENIEKIELSRGGSTRQLTKDLKYKNESEVIPNGAQWMIKITDAPVSYALVGVVTNSELKITMKSGKTLKDLGLEGKDIAINHVWVLNNGKIAAESVSNTMINSNKETTNGEFKNNFLTGKPGMKIIYRPKEGVLQTVHSFKSDENFLQSDYNWIVYIKELVPKELVPFIENVAWVKRTDEVGNEDRFTKGKLSVELYTDDQGRYVFDTSKSSNISIRTTGNANKDNLDEARKNLDHNVFYGVLGQSRNYTIEYKLKDDKTSKEFVETIVKYVQEHNQQVQFTSWMEGDYVKWAEKGDAEPPRKLDRSEHIGFIESTDSDGDGLFDMLEWIYETDYRNPDTDGDGVPDGQEVLTDKTDPLKANSYKPGKATTDTKAIPRDKAIAIKGMAPRSKYAKPFVKPKEALPVESDDAGGLIVRAVPYSVNEEGKPEINEKVVYAGTTISKANLDKGPFTLNIRPNIIPDSVKQIAIVTYSPDGKNPVIGDIISVGTVINFNPNGGQFGDSTASQPVIMKEGKVTLPEQAPTRKGYTLLGWSTKANISESDFGKLATLATEADWDKDSAMKVDATSPGKSGETVYAVWAQDTFKVRLHRNLSPTDDKVVEYVAEPDEDGNWVLPEVNKDGSELKDFHIDKYTFRGWAENATDKVPKATGTETFNNPRTGKSVERVTYQFDGSKVSFKGKTKPYTMDLYAVYAPYVKVSATKTWHADATSGATKYSPAIGVGLLYRTAVGEASDPVIDAQLADYRYYPGSYQESAKKVFADGDADKSIKFNWEVPGYDAKGQRLSFILGEIEPEQKAKLENWSGKWSDINIVITDNTTSTDGGKKQIVYAKRDSGQIDAYSGATTRRVKSYVDNGYETFKYEITAKNTKLGIEPPSLEDIVDGDNYFTIGLPQQDTVAKVDVVVKVKDGGGTKKYVINLIKDEHGKWKAQDGNATAEAIEGTPNYRITLPNGVTFTAGDKVEAYSKVDAATSDTITKTVIPKPPTSKTKAPTQAKRDENYNVVLEAERPFLGISSSNKYILVDDQDKPITTNDGKEIEGKFSNAVEGDKTIRFTVPDGVLKDGQRVKVRASEDRKTDSISDLSLPLVLNGPEITAPDIVLTVDQDLNQAITTNRYADLTLDTKTPLPKGFDLRKDDRKTSTLLGKSSEVVNETTLKLHAVDDLGNKSEKVFTLKVNPLPESAQPKVTQIAKKGDETARIVVEGKPNAQIGFKDADGNVARTITLDDSGKTELIVNPKDIVEGKIIVSQKEENHRPSKDVPVVLDTEGPDKPYIATAKEGADKIIVVPRDKDTEKVTLKLPDGRVLTQEKKDFTNGTAVFEIPKGVEADTAKDYVAVAYDKFNNPSDEATATIISKSADAEDVKASNKGENPTTTTVEGKTTPGAEITLKDAMGRPIETDKPVIADQDGKFTAEIPLQDKGAVVFVTAKEEGKDPSNAVPTKVFIDKDSDGIDDDKQASKPAEDVKALNQNKTEPNADPTRNDPKDTTTVTGKAVPGSKITIQDENGKDITPADGVKVDDDGNFTAEVEKQEPGKIVKVIVTEPTAKDGTEKKPSEPVEETVGRDANNDGKVDLEKTEKPTIETANKDENSVSGTAAPGAEVTVTVTPKGGEPKTFTGKADGDGNYKVTTDPLVDGDKVVVTASEPGKADNTSDEKVVGVDTSKLKDSIDKADKIVTDDGANFKPDTNPVDKALKDALDKGKKVKEAGDNGDPNTNQAAVDDAKKELDKAIAQKEADKAVDNAKDKVLDPEATDDAKNEAIKDAQDKIDKISGSITDPNAADYNPIKKDLQDKLDLIKKIKEGEDRLKQPDIKDKPKQDVDDLKKAVEDGKKALETKDNKTITEATKVIEKAIDQINKERIKVGVESLGRGLETLEIRTSVPGATVVIKIGGKTIKTITTSSFGTYSQGLSEGLKADQDVTLEASKVGYNDGIYSETVD